jgi:hypothetical protein
MFRSLFIEDIARFYQHGLLPRICRLLATRPEIWFIYGIIAAVYLLFAQGPRDDALMIFTAVAIACFYVTHHTVHILTPLWFGTFLYGRLKEKYKRYMPQMVRYGAGFLLVPSAAELNIETLEVPPGGTVGRTYLLLRHPGDPSIVLPIIDDDPRFMDYMMNYMLKFASNERRSAIFAEIERLRPSGD